MSPRILFHVRETQPSSAGNGGFDGGRVKEVVPFSSTLEFSRSSSFFDDGDSRTGSTDEIGCALGVVLAAGARPSISSAYCCRSSRWRDVRDLQKEKCDFPRLNQLASDNIPR